MRKILVLFAFLMSAPASAKLRIVTTIPSLASLAHEVGGDLVDVESLAGPLRQRYEAYQKQMAARIGAWDKRMAPYKGRAVVGFHKSIDYLTLWLGLKRAGFIEPLPGISPSPKHLATLILLMKDRDARV